MVEAHIDWLNQQIQQIESAIDDHIDGEPGLRNDVEPIRSIPGLGTRSAAQCLAYMDHVRRFKRAKALAAFVGVTSRQKQSGTTVQGRTIISRAGHTAARKSLYVAGLVAKRHNPVIAAMTRGLEKRGMAPKATVGASMRKLVHLIYGVIKSGRPFQAEIPMAELDTQDGI